MVLSHRQDFVPHSRVTGVRSSGRGEAVKRHHYNPLTYIKAKKSHFYTYVPKNILKKFFRSIGIKTAKNCLYISEVFFLLLLYLVSSSFFFWHINLNIYFSKCYQCYSKLSTQYSLNAMTSKQAKACASSSKQLDDE